MINKFITRKERIILTTIDLIHEIGIKDLSIKEIANREKVTEASLYKHFKSKEEILLEVLDYYSKFDDAIIKTLNNNSEDEKSNLITFFKLYSEYYDGYPQLTSIIGSYEVLLYEEKLGSKIKSIFNQKDNFVIYLIQKGQKEKNISRDIKPENLANILLGTFERLIFTWRLSNFEFSLKEKTIEIMDIILSKY